MSATAPHYLLLTQATFASRPGHPSPGHWRFVLATPDGRPALEAEDDEQAASSERLELLAVIRGLEAIDSPSQVVLLNTSQKLRRALEHDLTRWRDEDWCWERFGRMVPIKNADLWQRLDRLRTIHSVRCGRATLSAADDLRPPPALTATHLVVGERRLRIDRPASHSAPGNVSTDLEKNSDARRAGRRTALRHAAMQRVPAGRSACRSRPRFDRGPWERGLRGVWAAAFRWWERLRGRVSGI